MNADTMRAGQGKGDDVSNDDSANDRLAEKQEPETAPDPIDFDDETDGASTNPAESADRLHDPSADDSGTDDGKRILLDETDYGAVKDGVEIKAWQIDGLMRDNGKPHSPMFLKRNPPKLTFRSRNSAEDINDEYVVFLDKASARMLRDAMINVCNAYELKPVKKKHQKWTWRGFKDYVYDSFTDDPLKFIVKVALLAIVIVILIVASFNARW